KTATVSLMNAGSASVQISKMAVTGQAFAINWTSDLPIAIPAGGNYPVNLQFAPTAMGTATGQLVVTSASAPSGALVVGLDGTGSNTSIVNPAVASLACVNTSVTGSVTDPCTVTLSATAPTGGLSVSLSSNRTAVTIPASILVPAGAT